MNKAIIAILLVALVSATDAACTCDDGCNSVPVNQPIVVVTPPTIAPPECAIPNIAPPVINPPIVNIPVITPPTIEVCPIVPPSVVAPPTIIPPTPVIPVVTPPAYTPPTLPPQIPILPPVAPLPPVITLPTPPPSHCDQDDLSNKFTLSFQFACRSGVAFRSCLGEVVFNNVIVLSIVPSNYIWNTVNLAITVQPGRNALQFSGAGISDDFGLLIDNVRFVREGTSQNILINGDFSSPPVFGSWNIFNDISGWLGKGIKIAFGPNIFNAPGLSQVCELDGDGNFQITQYFTFDNQFKQVSSSNIAACNNPFPDTTLSYKLQFEWAVLSYVGSLPFDTSMGNVLWNNVVLDSLHFGKTNSAGVNRASYTVTLNSGENILQFDGTSLSDGFGLTIDNVRLTSIYDSTNRIVNGDFSSPIVGQGKNYFNGGILGWSAVKAEVGLGRLYNPNWRGPVLDLDSDSNQRYTQVITISQALYSQLIFQMRNIIQSGQVIGAANLAVQGGQNNVNNQLAIINNLVQCRIDMLASQFNLYLNKLYRCTDAAIRNVRSNQLVTINKYACASSAWLRHFGQSGQVDFTCDANEYALSSGWCTIIRINGKVINCRDARGTYHLQVAPCTHFEGVATLPRNGERIFWKGSQGSSGNIFVTVATTCNC